MEKADIKYLNEALKGVYMAIESFDHLILGADEDVEKEQLTDVQRHHWNQATRIADRIQQLGGNPVNSAGLAGVFAELKTKITPKSFYKGDVLATAIDGEKFGINAFDEIIDKLQDNEDKTLLNDINSKNRVILDELINFQR